MRAIEHSVHKEPPDDVAQCFHVDVSSFGDTPEEAVANLKEAVELDDEDGAEHSERSPLPRRDDMD